MSIRATGIPLWVTVLALILGLFAAAVGISALLDPGRALGYVPGADDLATTWAGRNAGLGVVLLVAVWLRSPAGYVVAFAGQVPREVADMLAAAPDEGGIAFTGLFLFIDVLGAGVSLWALRRATIPDPT